jgi:hypothetical protein
VEDIVDLVEATFEPTRRLVVVPTRDTWLIGPLAMHGRRIQGMVLPADRPDSGWPILPDWEWADLPLRRYLERLIDGIMRYMTLLAQAQVHDLVDEEVAALREAETDISESIEALVQATHDDDTGFLATMLNPVAQFVDSEEFGDRMAKYLRGQDDEVSGLRGTARLALIEWDLDSKSALELIERFIDDNVINAGPEN